MCAVGRGPPSRTAGKPALRGSAGLSRPPPRPANQGVASSQRVSIVARSALCGSHPHVQHTRARARAVRPSTTEPGQPYPACLHQRRRTPCHLRLPKESRRTRRHPYLALNGRPCPASDEGTPCRHGRGEESGYEDVGGQWSSLGLIRRASRRALPGWRCHRRGRCGGQRVRNRRHPRQLECADGCGEAGNRRTRHRLPSALVLREHWRRRRDLLRWVTSKLIRVSEASPSPHASPSTWKRC